MKILIVIFCLLSSIIINAQSIDYNNFKEEIINDVTFRMLKEYTLREGGYSLSHSSIEHQKIYNCIIKNHEEILLDALSAKINEIISVSSVGILDSISCEGIEKYQEIASRCITEWANSPSDEFFMVGWGKVVEVTSYYNKRSKTVYLSVVYQY
jgi:GTPase SAR1 family protein